MARKTEILDFIRRNPNTTTTVIAANLGAKITRVAVSCLELFNQGRLDRTPSTSANNRVTYTYTVVENSEFDRKRIPVKQTSSRAKVKVTARKKGVVQPRESKPISLDSLLNQIAQEFAKQIVQRVVNHVSVELTSMVPEAVPLLEGPSISDVMSRFTKTVEPAAPRLKKVLVTGLLPQQEGVLQAEFGDCFDLSFWNDRNGDGISQLKSKCAHVDHVLHHFGHSSHAVEDQIKKTGVPFQRISGGLTSMKNALLELYTEPAKQ